MRLARPARRPRRSRRVARRRARSRRHRPHRHRHHGSSSSHSSRVASCRTSSTSMTAMTTWRTISPPMLTQKSKSCPLYQYGLVMVSPPLFPLCEFQLPVLLTFVARLQWTNPNSPRRRNLPGRRRSLHRRRHVAILARLTRRQTLCAVPARHRDEDERTCRSHRRLSLGRRSSRNRLRRFPSTIATTSRSRLHL